MAKSIKINIGDQFGFILIAIVTTEPIYRLSWLINQEININLSDFKPAQVLNKQTSMIQSFTRFVCDDNNNGFYELIQNKAGNSFLIKEQKHVDYFLKISGSFIGEQDVVDRLKTIPNISLVASVDANTLKSKQRLISYSEEEE